jgi:murein DD-endopeptidase MepM/ murein hydrolase activator NlpD
MASSPAVPTPADSVVNDVDGLVQRSGNIFAEHVVREGQTLWQIASLYQVDINEVAIANGLSTDTILFVGQVLRVPGVETAIVAPSTSAVDVPRLVDRPSVPTTQPSVPVSRQFDSFRTQDSQLKAEQDQALLALQQKRDALEASLSGVPSVPQRTSVTAGERLPDLYAAVSDTLPSAQNNRFEMGFDLKLEDEPSLSDTKLDAVLPSAAIASLPLPSADLSDLNDSVDLGLTNPEPATLSFHPYPTVPQSSYDATNFAPTPSAIPTHQVARGDTIASLARTYNVSPDALVAENQIANPNLILVGQVLRIPGQAPVSVEINEAPTSLIAAAPSEPVFLNPSTDIPYSLTLENDAPSEQGTLQAAVDEPLTLPSTLPGLPPVDAADENPMAIAPIDLSPSVRSTPERTTMDLSMQFSVPSSESPSYLDQLMGDIASLREQAQPAAGPSLEVVLPEDSAVAEVEPADEQTVAARPTVPAATDRQLTRETGDVRPLPEGGMAGAETEQDLLAAAPLGAENYRPLIEPITGRMASPELPPLSGADRFLPSGTAVFDGFIWPASGVFTSGYGWRWGRMHRGIDIAAPVGTPIVAAAPGVVEFSGWNSGGYGNMVDIRHADGSLTRYAHNNRNLVQAGQRVEQGQQIAEMGSTGYSTGPHVHFEIHLPNQGTVNPMAFLPSR